MADINQVQLPDGSQYNITDTTSGYATQAYVQSAISGITKATIGLGNVDNTSDANKPVSTAQQTALDAKTNTSVIAYTETSTTATKRYEIGDQFILNGVLYTATAIIANGGTITVGTNCTASDTIIEQLSNISADDVSFDGTGTDLVSEDVDSAIKEVNAKFDREYVEVSADGVKTISQLLDELCALIDFTKLNLCTTKLIDYENINIGAGTTYNFEVSNGSNYLRFSYHYVVPSQWGIVGVEVKPTGSIHSYISSTTGVITDDSSSVYPNNHKLRLIY